MSVAPERPDELDEAIATRPPRDDTERRLYTERIALDLSAYPYDEPDVLADQIVSSAMKLEPDLGWPDVDRSEVGALSWASDQHLGPARRGADADLARFTFTRLINEATATGGRPKLANSGRRIVGNWLYFAERSYADPGVVQLSVSTEVALSAVRDIAYIYSAHPDWREAWRP